MLAICRRISSNNYNSIELLCLPAPVIPTKRLRAGCFQPLFLFFAVPFALFGGFAGCGLLFGRRTLPCRLAAGRRAKDRKLQPEKPLIAQ